MEMITLDNAVILDTETTGLGSDARIVEISIICASTGDVLANQLVNPLCDIPSEAHQIHGISSADVADKPTFDSVWNEIKSILFDRQVLIYNFDYDFRLIAQSLSDFDYPVANLSHMLKGLCVMDWYAAYYGEWSDYRESYKWQSLVNACAQQCVSVSDLTAHRATADCEMTRRLINSVNAQIKFLDDAESALEAHQDNMTDAYLTRRSGGSL